MVDLHRKKHKMSAKCSDFVELDDYEQSEFGEILNFCCKEFLNVCNDENLEQIKEEVKQGKRTFLFDENGNFNTNSFVSIT